MPYQVQQMIEDKGMPVCVFRNDPVTKALSLMIEHDYSQLPVIKKEHDFDIPEGMITYEGILRGVRNFNAKIEDLKVRDVMSAAPVYSLEDDLFDIFDKLKETNAVLVVYFHRTQRCVSCTYAEDRTVYTLETHFKDELDSGKIIFQSVDVQDGNNADIIEKYQAYTSQLFINTIIDNQDNIQHVEEIWAVIGDDEAFTELIINKITAALEGIQ